MKKVYKSKIGIRFYIRIIVLLGIVLSLIISGYFNWIIITILVLMTISIVKISLATKYSINGHILAIKSGFFHNLTIDINSIRKISETNNPISAPAISLDRLEIIYNKYDAVTISPKHKLQFIKDIKSINPDIEIKYAEKEVNHEAIS